MLEEIIVVARRREESLQDLPLSVAALSADAMQAQGIYNIDQIGQFVPNLSFATTDRRHRKAIFIRGIGNDSAVNLIPVGTGVYIDGHYLPNTVGQMFATVDVERVEVLRGPQGTLFGKNTTGGAINIISAKPEPEFESSLLLRVADFGQQDLRAMVNVPFSDTVYGRFSIAKETSDGYYFNRTLNTDIGATDLEAFGAAVRIAPNDNWLIDLALRANYQEDDDEGGNCRAFPTQSQVDNLANMHPDVLDAQINDPALYAAIVANHPAQNYTGPVFPEDEGSVGQWGGATRYPDGTRANIGGHLERLYAGATIDFWNACNEDNRQGDFVNSQEKDTFLELDNENFNGTIQWDSAGEVGGLDNLKVKLITAHHESEYNYIQDRDMSFLSIDAVGTPPLNGSGTVRTTTTVELLFTGDVNDRMQFIVGTHYFDDNTAVGEGNCLGIWEANIAAFSDPNSGLAIPCQPDGGTQFDRLADRQVPGGPDVFGRSGIMENESIAVYGHMTYDLNEDWTLDVGARWTDEDRLFNQIEFPTVASTCSHTQPGDPPVTSICAPDYILSQDSVLLGGIYNNSTANFSEVTPMASLTRSLGGGDVLEDGMVYFRYAEGFLSGSFNDGLNTILFPLLEPFYTYDPEHVNNYEIGFKGAFADGRLRLSSAVFFMDYEDKQEGILINNADGQFGDDPFIFVTANAASVDIYGIEFELRASPWDGGFVSLDLGYLKNEFGEFTSFDPDAPGGVVDLSNRTIGDYSPEWTLNASVEHAFVLGSGGTLTPQLGLYYQGEYDFASGFVDENVRTDCFQDAYTKLRARVTYDPPEGNWQASLFGSNINDERYFAACSGSRSNVINYRYGQPDTWGLEFVARWGNN